MDFVDIFALFAALAIGTYIIQKKRSRKGLFILMCCSLAYFGFYREGCVCSIGSIQNVSMALFSGTYYVPLAVLIYFMLPLLTAVVFGRTYCAAVCPLGAIQDLFVLKAIRIPTWLSKGLGIIPYAYLGLAVLYAATESGFLICRYDPFVSLFRLSGHSEWLWAGFGFLAVGTVIARPYCRYFCPYGVLLGWMSRFSKWHYSITPDPCVNCTLCENSCPFDNIRKPNTNLFTEPREKGRKRMMKYLVMLPLFIAAGGYLGSVLSEPMSYDNRHVALAANVLEEQMQNKTGQTETTETFMKTGVPIDDLFAKALSIKNQFYIGGWIFGGFMGLVIGLTLFNSTLRRKQVDYEVDRNSCFSCGRCWRACPSDKNNIEWPKGYQIPEAFKKPAARDAVSATVGSK